MLDIQAYRAAESAARAALPSWRALQVHRLDTFNAAGFPSRIESLGELGMLLDTMQEGRADGYRAEIGALTPAEAARFDAARDRQAEFVGTFFQRQRARPADDTLWSMLCLYRKLTAAAPGFRRVLEIGPGCGYLSFFLRGHEGLQLYLQTEACESFYLLQHFVNAWCFGGKAVDWVVRTGPADPDASCWHVPWWQVSEVKARCDRFDVVTANACLLEMTPAALDQYLTLAADVLPLGAPFVAQCFGQPKNGDPKTLAAAFAKHGFKVRSILAPNDTRPTWNGVWERS